MSTEIYYPTIQLSIVIVRDFDGKVYILFVPHRSVYVLYIQYTNYHRVKLRTRNEFKWYSHSVIVLNG